MTGAVLAMVLGGGPRAWGQETGLAVGSRAPAVVVQDLEGHPVDLGQYLGKQPILLEFWATWCEVCEGLLPTVRSVHQTYGDRVAFFGVNVTVNQTPGRVRRYVADRQPPFRTLYDAEGDAIRAYAAPTTSYIVIVDRSGKVAYTGTGGSQDLAAALRSVTTP
jgi:thiol-disulfide isomerase/thioredoxin